MSHATPDPTDAPGSVYDGLLEHHDVAGDDSQWAFGTDFEDPLAGVDTTVPDDLDASELAAFCLALGDDALVMSHRLSQWCSHAPDLEDDIGLANTALDLLGQARLLLARAAAADPGLVPSLPDGSPVPDEDALAFFRDAVDFRSVRLVEIDNGDFAHIVARLLLFATVRLAAFERLADHRDPVLAAIAAKGVRELTYHHDYAGRWFLTLAQGTEESRRRLVEALQAIWPLHAELVAAYAASEQAGGQADTASDLAGDLGGDQAGGRFEADVDAVLDQVFEVSALPRPTLAPRRSVGPLRTGHTEALSRLLAQMQVVARAHPMGLW